MQSAAVVAFAGEGCSTSVYKQLSTADDAIEMAREYFGSLNESLHGNSNRSDQKSLPMLSSTRSLVDPDVAWSLAPRQQCLAVFCLLVVGLGSGTNWAAVQAAVVLATEHSGLGRHVLLAMLTAYVIPMSLLVILQTTCEKRVLSCSSHASLTTRGVFGLLLSGLLVAFLPWALSGRALVLLGISLGLGVADGITYSALARIAGLYPQQVFGYFFIGSAVAVVAVIAGTLATNVALGTARFRVQAILYFAVAGLQLLAAIAFVVLLNAKLGRHYIGLRGMRGDLVLQANRANHVHYGNVLSRTWPYQCVAVLVEAPTAMVVAMIPFVPSSASAGPDGADWANPQIIVLLFFVAMVCITLGRQLDMSSSGPGCFVRGPKSITALAMFRVAMAVGFVLYLLQPMLTHGAGYTFLSDNLAIVFMAVYMLLGGYLSAVALSLARARVSERLHRKISVWHRIATVVALVAGLALALLVSFGVHPAAL